MQNSLRFWGLSLLLVTAAIANAQKVTVSTPSKISNDIDRIKIIGKNDDGYVVRLSGSEETFQTYNSDLRLSLAKKYDFDNNEGFIQHVQLYKTGAVVYSLKSEKNYTLLIGQAVNGIFQKTGEATTLDTIYETKEVANANLRLQVAANQKYVLFYIPIFSGKQVQAMQMKVVDSELKSVYQVFVPINRSEKAMEYARAMIDTQGNSLLITNTALQQYDATWISKDKSLSITNFKINYGKKSFGDPYFEIDNANHQLLFAGFYDNQDGTGESAAYGTFYQRYDPTTGTVIASNTVALPDSFMRQLTGREPSVTNNRLYTFQLRKIIQRKDGGVGIIAESYIRDIRQEQSIALSVINPISNYRTVSTFQYNDIIAFSLAASGDIVWSAILKKRQYSEEDNGFYSSFFMMNQKDRLHFVFADDKEQSTDISTFVVSSDGAFEKRFIVNKSDRDIQIVPKQGKQTALGELVMPSIKRSVFKLVRLKYF